MVPEADVGCPRRRDAPARRPAPFCLAVALAIVGFSVGCASTESPRELMNRLATPNEGVRADLELLEERVQHLEGLLAESESENARLRERIAEVAAALEEVRTLATAPPPPVPFEPPPPARVQVLEVTELDDTPAEAPAEAPPVGAAEPEDGAGADETGAPATIAEAGQEVGEAGQELYDLAHEKFLGHDYVEAELGFQRFLDDFPDSDLSDNALYWIGECRFARDDNRGAMAAFQTMLHEYPLGNKVPDALVKVGRTLERLGDTEGARRRFREVSRRFPDSGAARLATESLSRLQDDG